jgi:hypothetical protein
MSDHFHILVEVARRPEVLPGPEEILEELRRLSGHQSPGAVRQRLEMFLQSGDKQGLAAYLSTFHSRMYDVSGFMKLLKQRFTQWYNARVGRKGTLWEERFKSVLVDGAGHALVTMAAYIDLNPVRARLVGDPRDYSWCGYGEAVAGGNRAREGLESIVAALRNGRGEGLSRSLKTYRMHLYLEGDGRRNAVGPDGREVRGGLGPEEVAKVLLARGRLSVGDYLRCRVRYFCDGAVFGGREFVEGIFRSHRRRFGPNRKTGARGMRGLADRELFTMRDLQQGVFGAWQN